MSGAQRAARQIAAARGAFDLRTEQPQAGAPAPNRPPAAPIEISKAGAARCAQLGKTVREYRDRYAPGRSAASR